MNYNIFKDDCNERICQLRFRPLAGVNYNEKFVVETVGNTGFRPLAGVNYNFAGDGFCPAGAVSVPLRG